MKKSISMWLLTLLILQSAQNKSLIPYYKFDKPHEVMNMNDMQSLDWDLQNNKIKTKSYNQPGDIFISGQVVNNGNNPINYFNLVYQIGNEIPVTAKIDGLALDFGVFYTYVHPIAWKANQMGSFVVKVWTEDVNGNIDENHTNDTIVKTIVIAPPVPNIIDSYLTYVSKKTIIGNSTKGVNQPRDLDFHPILSRYELWVINKGTESSGGSTVKFSNAGLTGQTSKYQKDGNSYHFMSLPTGIAFSENENFATSTGVYDANHDGGNPFTGPALWSSDPKIYAITPPGGNGSHLDMLHQSPYCMGICNESDNVFWVTDGNSNDIVRYDFEEDHGPGQSDHSDGIIRRYVDAEFYAESTHDVVSHLVLDKTTNWLYYVSTADKKVKRLNISTGSFGYNLPPYEQVSEYSAYQNATVEDLITAGLTQPAGIELFNNRLLVSDFSTGDINFYDISGTNAEFLGKVVTGNAGIMGIKIGPDGKIWYVNKTLSQVIRLDTTNVLLTGINNITQSDLLRIYPNPVSSALTISTDNVPDHIILFNMTGQVIKYLKPNSLNSLINLIDLNSGVYLIQVNVNNSVLNKKIIKN
jgi:hypothetical protein